MANSYLDKNGVAYFWERIKNQLNGKVDKVNGKGLSSNDYTSDEKTKLANIAAGAQVNVLEGIQKNGTTVTITNKIANISVPTKTSDITNDSGFITSADVPAAVTVDDALSATSRNPVQNKVINTALGTKQATLVSGTNIKTINGTSIVGSGDVVIDGSTILVSPDSMSPDTIALNDELTELEEDLTNGFAAVARSGSYNDLHDTPTIPEGVVASSTTPSMDGTAAVGTETAFARGDHVHPHDTSKADKATTLAGYGITNAYTKTETNNQITSAISNKADQATTLSGYGITDAYTKTQIDQKLVGAMTYKGTVATTSALPASGNATGDMYHVTADGSEWAWNGTTWEELGSEIDLSGYMLKTDMVAITNAEIEQILFKA